MESLRWLLLKVQSIPTALLLKGLRGFLYALLIFWPLAMWWVHQVNDDLDYINPDFEITDEKGSYSVAMAASLIQRETREHRWTPNDPFFYPGAWLDRMPAYQMGIMKAIGRFALELSDQIGRTRGSSKVDQDLEKAKGLLQYSPHVWVFDFSTSVIPTTASDKQYLAGKDALLRYNKRLMNGEAVFERRSDNLKQTLDRIASDMGALSGKLAERVDERPLIDTEADELYYQVKGSMYAYAMLLRALQGDFADVIAEKNLINVYDQMLESFEQGARLNTFFVLNCAPDSQLCPNHLAAEGFYVLRARTQLKEVINILMN